MICGNCGFEFADGSTFCPNCGFATEGNAAQQSKPDFHKAPPTPVYDAFGTSQQMPPQQNSQYYEMPPYTPAYPQFGSPRITEQAMSVKDWVITFFIASVPIAGIIMLCVWAFGNEPNQTKSNYAKAMLIVQAISVALALLLGIFSALLGISFAVY